MINAKKIERLARQLHEAIPQGIREISNDLEKKFRQILEIQLSRLNLVTRKEFDIQVQILINTREKIIALEERLNNLEIKNKDDHDPNS